MEIDVKATNDLFAKAVHAAVKSAKTQAQSRAIRASNELRNSALRVLRGQRSGRVEGGTITATGGDLVIEAENYSTGIYAAVSVRILRRCVCWL